MSVYTRSMYGTLTNKQPRSVTPDKMKCVSFQGNQTKDGFDQLTINEKPTKIRDVGIWGVYNAQEREEREDIEGQIKWAHGTGEGLVNEGEYACI